MKHSTYKKIIQVKIYRSNSINFYFKFMIVFHFQYAKNEIKQVFVRLKVLKTTDIKILQKHKRNDVETRPHALNNTQICLYNQYSAFLSF